MNGIRHDGSGTPNSTPGLRVVWSDGPDVRSIWAVGEVDLASVDRLRRALDTDHPNVIVNLAAVTFMDMAGLRCLVDAGAGRRLTVIASPVVERLIEVTGTDGVFRSPFDEAESARVPERSS